MVNIYINGQRYTIPNELTILRAFEWAGYHLTRGVGCRGGFCGACSTVYRIKGEYHLHYALACQTIVQEDMILGQIPFFPANRPDYQLSALKPDWTTIHGLYPEILRCYGCNTCTKACPQEIDVLGYMSALVRGDISAVAEISFDCIMCGLCAARCPAEIVPSNVAALARRLYGKYLAPPAQHLLQRVEEINQGTYQSEITRLKSATLADLKQQYEARQIEV